MEVSSFIAMAVCLMIGTSYAWGMRGTTIGGEKGALLPGAVIGLLLAKFSGIAVVSHNYMIFAALGAIGMYFGGTMTYGETLGLSMNNKPAENMKKGITGVFVKGFVWFGSFGAVFSTGVNAVSGIFSLGEIITLLLLIPLVMVMFYFIFNKPLNAEKNIFPKLYFSKTRQESWGAMLGLFLLLTVVGAVKNSMFTVCFAVGSAAFGGVGWVIAQLLQIYTIQYAGNSGSRILKLLTSRKVDSWKIMECTIGAFAGLGAAVSFAVGYGDFYKTVNRITVNGIFRPLSQPVENALLIVWFVMLLADMAHYFVKPPKNSKEIPERFTRYFSLCEYFESTLYAGFPLMLIMFGVCKSASFFEVFIIYWVIVQEIAFEKTIHKVFTPILRLLLSIAGGGIIASLLLRTNSFTPIYTLILYTLVYEILTLIWLYLEETKKIRDGNYEEETKPLKSLMHSSVSTVHLYFIICAIATLVIFALT